MEETTHLKTATSVQRSLPVLGSWCAGEPGKMLRGASSKANDVCSYVQEESTVLPTEERGKQRRLSTRA